MAKTTDGVVERKREQDQADGQDNAMEQVKEALTRQASIFFPPCQKCRNGTLVFLSDYGQEGSSLLIKAWVCTNPQCGWSIRVDKGEVSYGPRVRDQNKH